MFLWFEWDVTVSVKSLGVFKSHCCPLCVKQIKHSSYIILGCLHRSLDTGPHFNTTPAVSWQLGVEFIRIRNQANFSVGICDTWSVLLVTAIPLFYNHSYIKYLRVYNNVDQSTDRCQHSTPKDFLFYSMPQKHKQLKSGFCRNICLFNQHGTFSKHQEQVLRGSSAQVETSCPDGENRNNWANMAWRSASELNYWIVLVLPPHSGLL